MTKLSIITINRNNAAGLRKTIESVVSQTFTDFEYIIIDGASTDDSVNIIKEYAEATLPCGEGLGERLYWVSEPDKGIYNAMNKGILKAKGEYLLFLNSGDWLVDERVVCDFNALNDNSDIISGNAELWDNNIIGVFESVETNKMGFDVFFYNTIPHQATFIKAKLFYEIGLYNEAYKIVSDWEFFIKALIIHNCGYCHLNRIIVTYDMQGISAKKDSNIIIENERMQVFNLLMPRIYSSFNKLNTENKSLKNFHDSYKNIVTGKFSFIILFINWIKKVKKKI